MATSTDAGEPSAPLPPETEGEATLLVSEFPPPPPYFAQADTLTPPPIPVEALTRGTHRAAAAAARAREAARQNQDSTGAILGGEQQAEEEEGDVVAVYGEIVEDPDLIEPLDPCEDPKIIVNQVLSLNHQVVAGFVSLVRDLVHRPLENKATREKLSQNIFDMLQESNKFREHQSRETLIHLLESQLAERKKLVELLEETIGQTDECLSGTTDDVMDMTG